MIAFPDTPENINGYDKSLYPHWHVFVTIQLGAPMPVPTAHWENAEIIAQIPEDKITTVTAKDLMEMGVAIGFNR